LEEITQVREDFDSHKQTKEKQHQGIFKPGGPTKSYNTVKNDNLSPTMYAYYFCNKSRAVLSDKEAAAISSMNLDNNFEENRNADAYSNQSEGSIQGVSYNNTYNDTPRLKRKRKNSTKLVRKERKVPRRGGNVYDDDNESFINQNLLHENRDEDGEEDEEEDKVWVFVNFRSTVYQDV
jgi:hypothetical protein